MVNIPSSEIAVVYVATGNKFIKEAEFSINSVISTMPDIKIYLFSDRPVNNCNLYKNIIIDKPKYSYIDKIFSLGLINEKYILYLDTDTYLVCPVYELFALLTKYDLACSRAPMRMCFKVDVPDAFSELNTGVLCLKSNNKTQLFFEKWRDTYLYQEQNQKPPHDQPSFREALWKNNLNFYILSPEYNCRFIRPGFLHGDVKILHGRDINLPAVAKYLNKTQKQRVHVPGKDKLMVYLQEQVIPSSSCADLMRENNLIQNEK